MPNYDFLCRECGTIMIENHKWESRPDGIICACGGIADYTIAMPNINGKASYLDGTKRFANMKEAAKLNVEAAGARNETKKEIAKEIKRMGVGVSK